ncbi:hypothetical protein MSAN_02323800 [Mycena sanguinolenta]|uniref:Uncharacterized protein n=1 Tax=Mycena sanguinolenta TaxID=230812 RepID=A0A8H6X899_9AGAR|nr:hypothetical protein MSAN_02323800 [Mycena sanguinolenta]
MTPDEHHPNSTTSLAGLVREVQMHENLHLFKGTVEGFKAVLRCLEKLEGLLIWCLDFWVAPDCLGDLHFENLSRFGFLVRDEKETSWRSFLERHPKITCMTVTSFLGDVNAVPTCMPNLREYEGAAIFLRRLDSESLGGIQKLTLQCLGEDEAAILSRLPPLRSVRTFVATVADIEIGAVLAVLADCVPLVEHLSWAEISPITMTCRGRADVAAGLKRLNKLRELSVNGYEDKYGTQRTVAEWGAACTAIEQMALGGSG